MTDWIQGNIVHKTQWTPRLISLRFDADVPPFKAGQFARIGLDINGERSFRSYSFVNAPQERPHEIYFNIVPHGLLSMRLATLEPGDTLWIDKAARGLLILDEIPDVRHLWMIATGTAIGPYLSILKTDEPRKRFEKIVLVHGVRTTDELAYASVISQLLNDHGDKLEFIPVTSRETPFHTLHGRIPPLLANRLLEQRANLSLDPECCHVMLCGNSGMIDGAIEILSGRGLTRHRRREPGRISIESYY